MANAKSQQVHVVQTSEKIEDTVVDLPVPVKFLNDIGLPVQQYKSAMKSLAKQHGSISAESTTATDGTEVLLFAFPDVADAESFKVALREKAGANIIDSSPSKRN
jgi:hypothetical protein